MKSVLILLSTPTFEDFYEKGLGFSLAEYVSSYRGDYSWYYAMELRRLGHDVSIGCFSIKYEGVFHTDDGVDIILFRPSPFVKIVNPFRKIVRGKILRYVFEIFWAMGFFRSVNSIVSTRKIEIIYVQEYWRPRFDILALLLGARVIGADHGGRYTDNLIFFKRWLFKRAKALTSQTSDELKKVSKITDNAVLIPNGVDTDYFRPDPSRISDDEFNLIVTVCRLNDDQKRISDLIKAISQLDTTWKLRIIGSGPDEAMLKSLVTSIGITDRVEFFGFISDKAMIREQYLSCKIFALVSSREGLPYVVLEAMSCGTVCLLSDIRAHRELVDDGRSGFLVPVNDVQGIVRAIIRSSTLQLSDIRSAARAKIVENYSTVRRMKELSELIER